MAIHEISLNDTQESVLQKVADLKGITPDELVTNIAMTALIEQVTQYIQEEAINKVKNLTINEKLTFLNN